jgi:hypothetical protein
LLVVGKKWVKRDWLKRAKHGKTQNLVQMKPWLGMAGLGLFDQKV